MSYVKTAISLQETLLQQIDALARELNISRSRFGSIWGNPQDQVLVIAIHMWSFKITFLIRAG